MDYFHQAVINLYQNIYYVISAFTVIVHLVCTLAVIRDLNNFTKHNVTPQMMPGFAWTITVLISGIWGIFIYWIMHHSSLSRR
ncbi:hypothetical protein [Cysteiniphilum litorale]|uniref:hypothetical protein n=1 Tax=Cysteiniphilum litorale TaxID=2056700 RepID=UPI003F883B20